MSNQKILKILEQIGLSPNESAVYFAALQRGPCSILNLAKASGIKRTTVYTVVDSLKAKGLVHIEIKGFKQLYSALHPEQLESILNEKRNTLNSILPELSAIYNLKGGESFIKYFEGLDAVKSVYEGLIRDVRPKEDYLIISDQHQWYSLDPKYFEDFTRRRALLDINIKLLLVDTTVARDFQKRQKQYNQTVKILPKGTALTTNMVVIPKKVVIHQLVPPIFAMVIENKSIVQLHRELFKILWEQT